MRWEARSLKTALLSMDRLAVRALLEQMRDREGWMPALDGLVVPALEDIGLDWEQGRLALAQVYMAGRICEEVIQAVILDDALRPQGDEAIGLAVFEDQHQLGKRIVGGVLKSAGYRVIDYGAGLGAEELARRAAADAVPVLMVSVLMMHSALHLKQLRPAFAGLGRTPVLVAGGAPFRFDPLLARGLGLDAVGHSASDALDIARRYLGEPCLR